MVILWEKKGKRKVQGLPQSQKKGKRKQVVAHPRHEEEEETEKTKQAQNEIELTYEKH